MAIHLPPIEWPTPPRGLKRRFRAMRKQAMMEGGRFWWQEFLPGHFTVSAESKYDYQPRSPIYQRRKTKTKGHRRPLEWSGTLRRNVTSQVHISGSSKHVTVRLPGSRVANFGGSINRKSGRAIPRMQDELRATTPQERSMIARVVEQRLAESLNRPSAE